MHGQPLVATAEATRLAVELAPRSGMTVSHTGVEREENVGSLLRGDDQGVGLMLSDPQGKRGPRIRNQFSRKENRGLSEHPSNRAFAVLEM